MQCVFPGRATLGISLGAVMVPQAVLAGLRTHRPSSSWLCHVLSWPAACGIISFLKWECPEDSNLIWEFPAGNRASAHGCWESSCVGSLKTHTMAQVPLYTCPSLSYHFLNHTTICVPAWKQDYFCKELFPQFLWVAIPYGAPNVTETPGRQ